MPSDDSAYLEERASEQGQTITVHRDMDALYSIKEARIKRISLYDSVSIKFKNK